MITRTEMLEFAEIANPNASRLEKAFLRAASPLLTRIANRQVEKQMAAIVANLENLQQDQIDTK